MTVHLQITSCDFVGTFICCLLTPIEIFVLQDYNIRNMVTFVLLICDSYQIISICLTRKSIDNSHWVIILVSLLPLLLQQIFINLGISSETTVWISILRCLRVLLIFDEIHRLKLEIEEKFQTIHETIYRVAKLGIFSILYSSTMACIWFYQACHGSSLEDCKGTENTWVGKDDIMDIKNPVSIFFRSLHFVAQTLLTVGYGDLHPTNNNEIFLALILILSGLLFNGLLISTITSLLSSRNITTKMYRTDLTTLKNFFNARKLNSELKLKFIDYFEFLFNRQCGLTSDKIFNSLPTAVVIDIKFSCFPALQRAPFFTHQNDRFTLKCCEKLEFRTYEPEFEIFNNESPGEGLVIVRSGKLEIFTKRSRKSILTLLPGDIIGDYSLLYGEPLGFEVRVGSLFTEAAVLTSKAFNEALEDFSAEETIEVFLGSFKGPPVLSLLEFNSTMREVLQELQVETDLVKNTSEKENRERTNSSCRSTVTLTSSKQMLRTGLISTYQSYQALLQRLSKTESSMGVGDSIVRNKRLLGLLEAKDSTFTNQLGKNCYVISPEDPFRLYWDVLIGFVIVFYNLAAPIRLVVESGDYNSWSYSLLVDYSCDAVLMVDLILRSRFFGFRTFIGDTEFVEISSDVIWANFRISTRFYLSLVILFPLEVLSPVVGNITVFRVTKIISSCLITTVVRDVQTWLDKERHVTLSAESVTVIQLTLYTVFVALWVSAGWFLLHVKSGLLDGFYWCFTTMTTTGYGDITPGSTNDTIFNTFVSFIGPSIFATIIAKFVSYVRKVDISTDNSEYRTAVVERFVQSLKHDTPAYLSAPLPNQISSSNNTLPESSIEDTFHSTHSLDHLYPLPERPWLAATPQRRNSAIGSIRARVNDLQMYTGERLRRYKLLPESVGSVGREGVEQRVREYLRFLDRGASAVQEDRLLERVDVPPHLMGVLRRLVVAEMLSSVKMFSCCDKRFLLMLMGNNILEQQMHCKNSFLLHNQRLPGLYLVKSGILKVRDDQHDRYQLRHPGDNIGSASLLSDSASPKLTMEASTDCEVWFLSRSKFKSILKRHPDSEKLRTLMKKAVATSKDPTPLLPQFNESGKAPRGQIQRLRLSVKLIEHVKELRGSAGLYLSPDGLFYRGWSTGLLFFSLYFLIVTPFRAAFFQGREVDWTFSVDYAGDFMFLVDILLRCSVFAYKEQDDLIRIRRKIFTHYVQSPQFYVHLAASLPLDLFVFAVDSSVLGAGQVLSLFRLNRLLRLADLEALISPLEDGVKKGLERAKLCVNKNVIRLFKFVMLMIMTAHICGCIFFFVGFINFRTGESDNWASVVGILPYCEAMDDCVVAGHPSYRLMLQQEVYSLYWAMAVLTTVGFGDIVPVANNEKMYNLLVFILGISVYALILVHLQDIVSELDVPSDIFKSRVGRVTAFIQREQLHKSTLSEAVDKYYQKIWHTQRGASNEEVARFLSPTLYGSVIHEALDGPRDEESHSPALNQLFFVGRCNHAFKKAFLTKIRVHQYLKGEFIFRTGEAAERLFFLHSGELSLVTLELNTNTISGEAVAEEVEEAPQSRSSVVGRSSLNTVSSSTLGGSGSEKGARRYSRLGVDLATSGLKRLLARGPGSRRPTQRKASYMKLKEGWVAENEFFTRSCYSCSAKVNKDMVLLEVDAGDFWGLLGEFRLERVFQRHLQREHPRMARSSTMQLVRNLDSNMSHTKMRKMWSIKKINTENERFLHPNATFRRCWDALVTALLVLLAVDIPYVIAFSGSSKGLPVALDTATVFVFAVDIYFKFNLFAVVQEGCLITETQDFSRLYLRTDFWLDFLGTAPFSLFLFAVYSDGMEELLVWYTLSRVFYLTRLRRAGEMTSRVVKSLFSLVGVSLPDPYLRLTLMLFFYLLAAHIIACLFSLLGTTEELHELSSWVSRNGLDRGEPFWMVYFRALYWSLYTLTTVGYGSISLGTTGELLFATVVMPVGSVLSAATSAVLGGLLESADGSNNTARRACEAAVRFCHTNGIEKSTVDKVTNFFHYKSSILDNTEENEDFQLLSRAQRMELVLCTAWRGLKKVQFLDKTQFNKNTHCGFLFTLARSMELYLAIPGEVLLRRPLSPLTPENPARRTSNQSLGSSHPTSNSSGLGWNSGKQPGSSGSIGENSVGMSFKAGPGGLTGDKKGKIEYRLGDPLFVLRRGKVYSCVGYLKPETTIGLHSISSYSTKSVLKDRDYFEKGQVLEAQRVSELFRESLTNRYSAGRIEKRKSVRLWLEKVDLDASMLKSPSTTKQLQVQVSNALEVKSTRRNYPRDEFSSTQIAVLYGPEGKPNRLTAYFRELDLLNSQEISIDSLDEVLKLNVLIGGSAAPSNENKNELGVGSAFLNLREEEGLNELNQENNNDITNDSSDSSSDESLSSLDLGPGKRPLKGESESGEDSEDYSSDELEFLSADKNLENPLKTKPKPKGYFEEEMTVGSLDTDDDDDISVLETPTDTNGDIPTFPTTITNSTKKRNNGRTSFESDRSFLKKELSKIDESNCRTDDSAGEAFLCAGSSTLHEQLTVISVDSTEVSGGMAEFRHSEEGSRRGSCPVAGGSQRRSFRCARRCSVGSSSTGTSRLSEGENPVFESKTQGERNAVVVKNLYDGLGRIVGTIHFKIDVKISEVEINTQELEKETESPLKSTKEPSFLDKIFNRHSPANKLTKIAPIEQVSGQGYSGDETNEEDNKENPNVALVVAETFCHLFHVPGKKIREIQEYYRLTQLPVARRMSAVLRKSDLDL